MKWSSNVELDAKDTHMSLDTAEGYLKVSWKKPKETLDTVPHNKFLGKKTEE